MRKELIIPIALLVLTLLLVITIIIVAFFNASPGKTITKEAIILTPTPVKVINNLKSIIPISSRAQLIRMLPVRTDVFTIEYLAKSDTIIVTITKNPYTQNKQKALDWFKERGITDINSLNILLVHLRYVK